MLNAAALSYVAAVVTAVLQLLYCGGLVGRFGRRRRWSRLPFSTPIRLPRGPGPREVS